MIKEINTCTNCGIVYEGNYCNNCGEKRFSKKDRSLAHLFEEAFHFITHFDGTFFTTVKTILTRPGKLSLDFCSGARKKYFRPLSFFLLLVVFYLLFPLFAGLNMDLKFHETHSFYGKYAAKEVAALQPHYGGKAALSEAFHHKAEKISKFLLFILIPLMALITSLFTLRKKRLFYDHIIFSTEEISVLLLWGFLVLPALVVLLGSIFRFGVLENELFLLILVAAGLGVHCFLAARRFFQLKKLPAAAFAVFYTLILFILLENVYKFILFFITIKLLP